MLLNFCSQSCIWMFYRFFAMNQSLKILKSYKTTYRIITTVAVKGISKLTNYFKTKNFILIFRTHLGSIQLSIYIIFREQ